MLGCRCPDIVKEYKKFDCDPGKWIKTYRSLHSVTKQPWECDVQQFKSFSLPFFKKQDGVNMM